jgi:Ni/Fe-hydrogenase subunit HybB-like protein
MVAVSQSEIRNSQSAMVWPMTELTYRDIHEDVLAGTAPPGRLYRGIMVGLAAGIAWAGLCWLYQVKRGMGVAGLNQPVGWAFYITNFVFWVGIGHAGTLISAILHLVRSRWRTSISRAAEAMTVFAVMTAGLFPLIHLGRFWVFFWIVPYPSERQLWPDFTSPLVWDVIAVTTYLTVSTTFWLVGLMPDAASARDRAERLLGPAHWRTRLYRLLAVGWTGSSTQWRHFGRAYLFFAALATPLVISVHSVVSWDFAMSNLPGWHTTIFAPYFVAGAIHSGLAMVLVLMIPMRRLLKLDRIITKEHFAAMATTMLVTGIIVAYAYVIEPFMAWYSRDKFEAAFAAWRATGWIAPFYWALFGLNVLAPLAFLFRKARRSLTTLLIVGVLVNVGMWLERWVIIVGSLSHDFLPHNWHTYAPTWVEISITAGGFSFFLFWFLGFAKLLPTVAIADVKEHRAGLLYVESFDSAGGRPGATGALCAAVQAGSTSLITAPHKKGAEKTPPPQGEGGPSGPGEGVAPVSPSPRLKADLSLRERGFSAPDLWGAVLRDVAPGRVAPGDAARGRFRRPGRFDKGVLAVFTSHEALIEAVKRVRASSFRRVEAFSPFKLEEVGELLHRRGSPVRLWTLTGALSGLVGGFWLAIGSAQVNNLWVGGKFTPAAVIPYCIIAFEGTILLGALFNLAGMAFHARLGRPALPACYDRRFTLDRFGLFLACSPEHVEEAKGLLASSQAEEVRNVD